MECQAEDLKVVTNGKTLLQNISFKIPNGSFVAIIGPNGAGKTTLLKSLAGLLTFTGNFIINGKPSLGLLKDKKKVPFSYTPQNFSIPVGMTLGEYIMLGRASRSNWFFGESQRDYDAVNVALERLKLFPKAKELVTNLSGGEMQRATLARALAQEADFLLLDEPTASLDFARTIDFLQLIDLFRKQLGLTVLLSTHDINSIIRFADYALVLKKGKNIHSGNLNSILQKNFLSDLYETKLDSIKDKTGYPIFYAKNHHTQTSPNSKEITLSESNG